MAKPIEKKLYEVCLDIKYAYDVNEDFLRDLKDQIKDARKQQNKINRVLKKAIEKYELIYKRKPDLGK